MKIPAALKARRMYPIKLNNMYCASKFLCEPTATNVKPVKLTRTNSALKRKDLP
jgi:hypothetical protein